MAQGVHALLPMPSAQLVHSCSIKSCYLATTAYDANACKHLQLAFAHIGCNLGTLCTSTSNTCNHTPHAQLAFAHRAAAT